VVLRYPTPTTTTTSYPDAMLFDLRGRGRRRTIQVIYLFLALLMGGGLVLFGIGGNTSGGGLLDAFTGNGGGGAPSFEKRIESAEKKVAATPRNPAVWASLTRLRYQQATIVGYDQNANRFTGDGIKELRKAATAWNRYLALNPKKADANLAILMAQAFGPAGLNQLDKAVEAMEVVTENRPPSAALFTQLATLAYAAGQTRKGDLARQRALALATKDQRAAIKAQLDLAKAQGAAGAGQSG
jgi:hypothetical protein